MTDLRTLLDAGADPRDVLEQLWLAPLLDLAAPGAAMRGHGLRTARRLLLAERLRREGAAAYVWKAWAPEDLITAIRAAAAGEVWPPGPVGEAPAQLPHDRLSAREYQIFKLVHQGRTVSEVAAELNLAMPTVSTHLKRIREKLGARTVAEITAYAHQAGRAT